MLCGDKMDAHEQDKLKLNVNANRPEWTKYDDQMVHKSFFTIYRLTKCYFTPYLKKEFGIKINCSEICKYKVHF